MLTAALTALLQAHNMKLEDFDQTTQNGTCIFTTISGLHGRFAFRLDPHDQMHFIFLEVVEYADLAHLEPEDGLPRFRLYTLRHTDLLQELHDDATQAPTDPREPRRSPEEGAR